jgi:hypothetical protein
MKLTKGLNPYFPGGDHYNEYIKMLDNISVLGDNDVITRLDVNPGTIKTISDGTTTYKTSEINAITEGSIMKIKGLLNISTPVGSLETSHELNYSTVDTLTSGKTNNIIESYNGVREKLGGAGHSATIPQVYIIDIKKIKQEYGPDKNNSPVDLGFISDFAWDQENTYWLIAYDKTTTNILSSIR